MTGKRRNPYAELQGVFHEPNRLAIVSHLAGARDGLPFTRLRDALSLTDGNLSRHLKTLSEAGMVRIEKTFVGAKPRTTVDLTEAGRARFLEYLKALEAVLEAAVSAMRTVAKRSGPGLGKAALEPA